MAPNLVTTLGALHYLVAHLEDSCLAFYTTSFGVYYSMIMAEHRVCAGEHVSQRQILDWVLIFATKTRSVRIDGPAAFL
jgi:hypothetical protein